MTWDRLLDRLSNKLRVDRGRIELARTWSVEDEVWRWTVRLYDEANEHVELEAEGIAARKTIESALSRWQP